jgi:hypothetical protein
MHSPGIKDINIHTYKRLGIYNEISCLESVSKNLQDKYLPLSN